MKKHQKLVLVLSMTFICFSILVCCGSVLQKDTGRRSIDSNSAMEEIVMSIADSVMIKHRIDLNGLEGINIETPICFAVHYFPTGMVLGGGGVVVISKPDLEVVDFIFFQ